MIKNQNQLTTAKRKRDSIKDALGASTDNEVWDELLTDVQAEIDEYCGIVDGHVNAFEFESLDDLGDAAIKARLARSMTQKVLAERLGVSGQMVQRDEAGEYEGVGLSRLAEIFDALGYRVSGCVAPIDSAPIHFRVRTGSPITVNESTSVSRVTITNNASLRVVESSKASIVTLIRAAHNRSSATTTQFQDATT